MFTLEYDPYVKPYWKDLVMKRILPVILLAALLSAGCQSLYNTTLERMFGFEKRELLKKAIESVNHDQEKAQVEFKDALTVLKELYAFHGGDLERMYDKFKASYEDANAQAALVHKRIANMENVAHSMFAEWQKEIRQYTNDSMAADSRAQLAETKKRYSELSRSVREAEKSMKPVLKQLNNNVLYLKHNLNAAAIGSLKGESAQIETQIDELIQKMNASMAESEGFIRTMLKK